MVIKLRLFNFSCKTASIFLITKTRSCMLAITSAKLPCGVKDEHITWLNYQLHCYQSVSVSVR